MVDNCYQCSHYQPCFLRIGVENLLDSAFHKEVSGGKPMIKNCTPLSFFRELAKICKQKVESDIELNNI